MKKAFTLIELMIVISVIGLLAAIAIPKFNEINRGAKVANVQGNLVTLRTSIGIYYVKTGSYPDIENNENLESILNFYYKFTDFYNKSVMPVTPPSEGTSETNNVVSSRDNLGGWLYFYESGDIYANLENGTYTGHESIEIWEEEKISEDTTNEADNSSDNSTWDDFISNYNVVKDDSVVNIGHGGYVSTEGIMPGLYLGTDWLAWDDTGSYTGTYYIYVDGELLETSDGEDYYTGTVRNNGSQVESTQDLYVGVGANELTVAFEYEDENGELTYYYNTLDLYSN
ncbi:prepilin-type N-terminal cleavage/methylation domain-containing protein [uncultured Ilyobacter sp.]|uniref:type IV pilin protein n=1 Tax=uncultured Ilyobacter sp. TaxID=544433 RepID=UPI0029C7A9EE|nr:prepilin-type N-terminal cleavage/methylation domain-containing protein [uncultured Ilyobacter sp.]